MPKPQCGSTVDMGPYNTPLHVGALFLILILSTCGMGLQGAPGYMRESY